MNPVDIPKAIAHGLMALRDRIRAATVTPLKLTFHTSDRLPPRRRMNADDDLKLAQISKNWKKD